MNLESWHTLFQVTSFIGLGLILIATIGSSFCSSRLDGQKEAKIDDLVDGKNKLLALVAEKDKRVEELEAELAKAKTGITSTFDFRGVKWSTDSVGMMRRTDGPEVQAFKTMDTLAREERAQELYDFSKQQVAKNPEWLTPYLLQGMAAANLKHLDEAERLIRYFLDQAERNARYKQGLALAAKCLAELQAVKEGGPNK